MIPRIAFVTPDGGEFLRLPFGPCDFPLTFQFLMTTIFNKYLFTFVLIFLHDVLVISESEEEHDEHLRITVEALRNANFKLKPKKSKLY